MLSNSTNVLWELVSRHAGAWLALSRSPMPGAQFRHPPPVARRRDRQRADGRRDRRRGAIQDQGLHPPRGRTLRDAMTAPSLIPLKICRSSAQSRRHRWSGLTSDTSSSLYSAPVQSAIAHMRPGPFHQGRGPAGLGLRPEAKRSSRIWQFSFDRGKGPDAQVASLSIMPASPLCHAPSTMPHRPPRRSTRPFASAAASDRRSPRPRSMESIGLVH